MTHYSVKACILGMLALAWPGMIVAQTTSTSSTPNAKTTLDPAPWASPRAEGMGGALSTVADDLDAVYYNPAGIGGQTFEGRPVKTPWLRRLIFPRMGATANQNAIKLNEEFKASGAQNDAQAGAAILNTHEGDRQYARVSASPIGLILGRVALVPAFDQQIAAIPQGDNNSDVEFRYRTFSGAWVGSSVTDAKGHLSLGVSTQLGTIEETTGTSPYVDMVDVSKRKSILKNAKKTYKAKGSNIGLTWRVPHSWSPTLAIVSRNVGSTKNPSTDHANEPLRIQEDVTAGFGLSPVMSWGQINWVVEAGYLTDKNTAARKKLRSGIELLIGGQGSLAVVGLRAGATEAGASGGLSVNLGILGIEASTHAVDVGVDNERVIEQRYSGTVSIDVASF